MVIGVTLQYFFSKSSELRKQRENIKIKAYVDFLHALAELQMAENETKKQEALRHILEAKTRITVYGSKDVVKAIADFWRAGAEWKTPKGKALFLKICQTMRNESLPGGQMAQNADVAQLLFGEDIELT